MSTAIKKTRAAKAETIEQRSTLQSPIDAWLVDALGGGAQTASKQIVNAKSALGLSPWFDALRCISEDTAKLPIQIIKKTNGQAIEQSEHYLNYILNVQPNEDMSAMGFWETVVSHALAWSGGYAEIQTDASGQVVGLYPLDPTTVSPVRDKTGRLVYRIQSGNGYIVLDQSKVFHLHGLSFDGIAGYDIANLAKEVIGNGLAALKFSGSFFGNGANIGGFISTPNALDPKARETLREALQKRYSGASNGHKLMVLEQGMTFEKTSVDPEKSSLIESLKFSVDDVARYFRIPGHKIGSLDRATFATTAEMNQNYIDETLSGWTKRIQLEIRRKLMRQSEKNLEVKHDFSDLLKGDSAAQADYFSRLFLNGFISQNEVRANLGYVTIGTDGDKFYRPANIVPIDEPIPPVQPAPDIAKNDVPALQDGEKTDKAVRTHQKLLTSTVKRLLRHEQDKVQRYSKDYAADVKIKEFYTDFAQNRVDEVAEILESFRDNSGLTFDVKKQARNIINKHIEQSIKESSDSTIVSKWLGKRAEQFAAWEISNLLEQK